MSVHPAISAETYREKALRKFKQQPLVPVGAGSFSSSLSFRIDCCRRLHRSCCHDSRTRNRDDEDAQGSVELLQQLAACTYRRAGTHCRGGCRWLLGVRRFDSRIPDRDSRGTGQGNTGAGGV